MMDYAATALQQQTASPQPELGRLKAAAERIASATSRIDGFACRFHGPTPETGRSAGDAPMPPPSYRNDLETLFAQIEWLEITSCYLDTIG